ncbi:MAG: GNAT family N-acetyltransferase [Thalassovita sp.]
MRFVRLPQVDPADILQHMQDPRVAEHMPLLTFQWDAAFVDKFVAMKEACWARDGLGHWAFLQGDTYVGWGGFQKEGDEWDFGLVLDPAHFGLGLRITRDALAFARGDDRVPYVTFILPPSRKNLGALKRLGAEYIGDVMYDEAQFMKYRLATETPE